MNDIAESYSVEAILSASDRGFTSAMKSAISAADGVDNANKSALSSIKKIATGIGAYKLVTAAASLLANSVGDAVDRYDTLNRYPKVMQNLGYSTEETTASTKKLTDSIQGLPTTLDSVVSNTQKLTGIIGDLEGATDTTIALNNAFLASGSSVAEAERGVTQYTQMLSRGTVDIVSLRTLQETMASALSQTAKSLGITSGSTNELYDALKDGTITFDEFNAKLIELDTATGGFADQARTATEGIGTGFANMRTAVDCQCRNDFAIKRRLNFAYFRRWECRC